VSDENEMKKKKEGKIVMCENVSIVIKGVTFYTSSGTV